MHLLAVSLEEIEHDYRTVTDETENVRNVINFQGKILYFQVGIT